MMIINENHLFLYKPEKKIENKLIKTVFIGKINSWEIWVFSNLNYKLLI
jgi:hypothetical protein